ncbi:MAG: hypothetical protein VW258_00110 [Thalassolituus sp.]
MFRSLVSHIALLLATLISIPAAFAGQTYIGLRSGPSPAFPVIYEVTEYRELDVIYRRGSWLYVTDSRSNGWIHLDDLHLLRKFPRDELWKLTNEARPGKSRLGFASTTHRAYAIELIGPVFSQDMYLRYTRGPEGDTAWTMLDVGIHRQFAEPTDSLAFNWSLGAGQGQDGAGSDHWSLDGDQPVWVGTGGFEAVWTTERYFEIGFRGDLAVTLDDDMTTYTTAALIWRMRL